MQASLFDGSYRLDRMARFQPVTTSAALSDGTLTTTLLPDTLTDCGAGLNAPVTLTPEPAIVIAVEVSEGAVRT
jgi:hypothetical protein